LTKIEVETVTRSDESILIRI